MAFTVSCVAAAGMVAKHARIKDFGVRTPCMLKLAVYPLSGARSRTVFRWHCSKTKTHLQDLSPARWQGLGAENKEGCWTTRVSAS